LTPNARTSGTTTQTDTCSQRNPGKSRARPNESPGSKPIAQTGLPRQRSPNQAPIPDCPTLRPDPDRAPGRAFHAAKPESEARLLALARRQSQRWFEIGPELQDVSGRQRTPLRHRSPIATPRDRAPNPTEVRATLPSALTEKAPVSRPCRRAGRGAAVRALRREAWPPIR
jgi:hypothetical protein